MSEHEFEGHREFGGQADPASDLADGQGPSEPEVAPPPEVERPRWFDSFEQGFDDRLGATGREPGYQEAAEELGSLVARDPDQALRAIGYDPATLSPEDREGMLAGIREALEDEPQEPPLQEPPPVVPPGVLDEIRAAVQPQAVRPAAEERLLQAVGELRREFPFLRTEEGERAVKKQLRYAARRLGHPELAMNPEFARDTILAMMGADADPGMVFGGAAPAGGDGGEGGGEGGGEAEADHPFVQMWQKGQQRKLRLDEGDRVQ